MNGNKERKKESVWKQKIKWGVPGQPEWLKNGERRTKRRRQALEMLLRQWLCSDIDSNGFFIQDFGLLKNKNED